MISLALAIILVGGAITGWIFKKIGLPALIGMMVFGIIIGNYTNFISDSYFEISDTLKAFALIIILTRSGLSIEKQAFKEVGPAALRMSIIPCLFEGFTIAILAKYLLDFTFVEGAILGFMIAAVSPAVIVPAMIRLINAGHKKMPTLSLVAASVDDVVAIIMFSIFIDIYTNHSFDITNLLYTFLKIGLSLLLGFIGARTLAKLVNMFNIRISMIIIYILGFSFFLNQYLGLVGIIVFAYVIKASLPKYAETLKKIYGSLWDIFEIILFVTVGLQLVLNNIFDGLLFIILIIIIGLIFRSIGVIVSLANKYTKNESIFTVLSFLPKATVQAGLASIPLSLGIRNGNIMLTVAVVAILFTAPIGAFLIDKLGNNLLGGLDENI